jgi:hypothetical protein
MMKIKPSVDEKQRRRLWPNVLDKHGRFCSSEYQRNPVSMICKPIEPPAR